MLGVIGVLALAIGIGLGVHTLTISDGSRTISCGSAFSPSAADGHTEDIRNIVAGPGRSDFGGRCEAIAQRWQVISWTTVAFGVVVLVGAALIKPRRL